MQRFALSFAFPLACFFVASESTAQPVSSGVQQPLVELVRQMDPSRSPTERLQAAEAIAGYGEHAVPYLVEMLDHADRRARSSACLALSRIGPRAVQAVPRLTAALDDPLIFVRSEAAHALGQIGPGASEATARLVTFFGDSDFNLRQAAITAVGRIGPASATEVTKALQGGGRDVRLAACTALQAMEADAGFALAELVHLSSESDPELRDAVFLTLASVGHLAVEPLIQLLHAPDVALRRRAAMALGRIGPPAVAAVPHLRRSLFDDAPDLRFWAAKALGEIGPDAHASIDDLAAACSDQDPDVRWQAAVSLEMVGEHARADRAWSVMCDDPHQAIRNWAATRLADH